MTALRIAALFGLLAVLLGAFGAHGLEKTLVANGRVEEWKTASLYHLVHALVLLVLATNLTASGGGTSSPAFWLFSIGIVLFSGSLYLLCLTNMKGIWWVTPLGGLFLIGGWGWLLVRGLK